MMTIPTASSQPMALWLRRDLNPNKYLRAHLEPECHALSTRVGTPVQVQGEFVRNKTKSWSFGIRWKWVVRIPIESPLYSQFDALLCSLCLDKARKKGLIPDPEVQ